MNILRPNYGISFLKNLKKGKNGFDVLRFYGRFLITTSSITKPMIITIIIAIPNAMMYYCVDAKFVGVDVGAGVAEVLA